MSEEAARPGSRPVGLIVLAVIVALGIAAIFWGRFVIDPDPQVFLFDAGPIADYQVGELRSFPEANIHVIALDDDGSRKELRALDARAPATGCTIELDPDDPRGEVRNPLGRPGSFSDTCSQAVWYLTGDALDRTSAPLRTFRITQPPPEDARGLRIVEVEVIGRADPLATETAR